MALSRTGYILLIVVIVLLILYVLPMHPLHIRQPVLYPNHQYLNQSVSGRMNWFQNAHLTTSFSNRLIASSHDLSDQIIRSNVLNTNSHPVFPSSAHAGSNARLLQWCYSAHVAESVGVAAKRADALHGMHHIARYLTRLQVDLVQTVQSTSATTGAIETSMASSIGHLCASVYPQIQTSVQLASRIAEQMHPVYTLVAMLPHHFFSKWYSVTNGQLSLPGFVDHFVAFYPGIVDEIIATSVFRQAMAAELNLHK